MDSIREELDRMTQAEWDYACEVMERINSRQTSDLADEIKRQRGVITIEIIEMHEIR